MSLILGLDLGTTGNRAVVFNQKLEIMAQAYVEFPQNFPRPGWVEQDPEQIWQACYQSIAQVIQRINPQNLVAIGLTNQRETTIVWDKQTGIPVAPAIVWQCRRSEAICQELKAYKQLIKEKTGLLLDPYFSATKLRWLFKEQPQLKKRAQQGELAFGTVDTWIMWKLTNGKVHLTEPSNASRTMLYNIHENTYDQELLQLMDIPAAILPEVRASDSEFAIVEESIIPGACPIVAVLGDQQASLFAHSLNRPRAIKNTYGTGLFVMAQTGSKVVQSDRLVSTIAWEVAGQVSYAIEGSVFVGGSAIQWLRDGLGIIEQASETESLAQELKTNEGVYFIPALTGLGAPYWQSSARGQLTGLTRGTSRKHIARAALEAMAYQVKDVVEALNKDFSQGQWSCLRADGGASANNFLMQFQADVLNLPVERPAIMESTVLGVVALAGIKSGLWNEKQFYQLYQTEKVFHPIAGQAEQATGYYKEWLSQIENLLNHK